MKGRIHSIETLGTLDGPGLRTVIFYQGCPLRCKFCHNPDTVMPDGGKEISVEELFEKVIKNKEYWFDQDKPEEIKGGVTLSGGDPLFQPDFILELIKKLKEEKVHIAVDTSLFTNEDVIERLLPYVDLWMISIKHMDDDKHKDLTSQSNKVILKNIKTLDNLISKRKLESKIRIRFLVIPGITDNQEHIGNVRSFIKGIENLEKIEVLAYGSHGKFKWEKLFGKYELEDVRDANKDDVRKVEELLSL